MAAGVEIHLGRFFSSYQVAGDSPDSECRDGGPKLVIRGEHPVIAMPVLPRPGHARRNHERRMRVAWEIAKPHLNPHIERMKHRVVKALQMLSPYDKQLLEDHVIEGVTLQRIGREQNLDRRTIHKRIKRAIQRLREAEKDLP
jgi:RNA polymerase sigma factor (sigma-70 family)